MPMSSPTGFPPNFRFRRSPLDNLDESPRAFAKAFGGFFGLGVVAFCVVGALILLRAGQMQQYVRSGNAEKDALNYGCTSGTAERATCRTCSSENGVCCDLRCAGKDSTTDVRLRCTPGDGCILAPAAEIHVTNFGTSTTITGSSE